MVWKTCDTCKGSGRVPNTENGGGTKTCTACKGAGGANTMTTP